MVGVRFPLEKISCFLYCTIKITLGIDKLLKAHYLGSDYFVFSSEPLHEQDNL